MASKDIQITRIALRHPLPSWPILLLISTALLLATGLVIQQWLAHGEFVWWLALLIVAGILRLLRGGDRRI
jgi:hypothetical protein